MTISQLPYPLRFSIGDRVPLLLEDLAKQMRVSRAFLRLCAMAGAPLKHERISAAEFLRWLFDHYESVRELAGLKAFAPVDGVPAATMARLRVANAVVTLLEFARTRATNWRQKRQLRLTIERLVLLSDRAV